MPSSRRPRSLNASVAFARNIVCKYSQFVSAPSIVNPPIGRQSALIKSLAEFCRSYRLVLGIIWYCIGQSQAVVQIRQYPIKPNKPKIFFAGGVSLRAFEILPYGDITGAADLNITHPKGLGIQLDPVFIPSANAPIRLRLKGLCIPPSSNLAVTPRCIYIQVSVLIKACRL